MVGGKVIGIVRRLDGVTMLHVRDECNTDRCCVNCRERRIKSGEPVQIGLGDSVWWQSGLVMWTPHPVRNPGRCGIDFDIQLPKVGYSHNFGHERVEV